MLQGRRVEPCLCSGLDVKHTSCLSSVTCLSTHCHSSLGPPLSSVARELYRLQQQMTELRAKRRLRDSGAATICSRCPISASLARR